DGRNARRHRASAGSPIPQGGSMGGLTHASTGGRGRDRGLSRDSRVPPSPGLVGSYDGTVMLVERDHQLDTLGSYLDDAATGHGRLVYVSGEAGVGKSALVSAFASSVAPRAHVSVAYCDGS